MQFIAVYGFICTPLLYMVFWWVPDMIKSILDMDRIGLLNDISIITQFI